MSRISFTLAIAAASLLVSSCGSKSNDPTPRQNNTAGPTVVNGIVLLPQPLENTVRSSGTVLASESVDLFAEAAGRVEKISFKEGSRVRKGEILLKMNDDDLQAQLRKTELQIQLAADQEKRQAHLFQTQSISKEQYDIAVNQVNVLRADRDNLVASIRKREIRAPFDGLVGLRFVSEGGYVTPSTRIASLQKTQPVKVDFGIPEKYAGLVVSGDAVHCSNDQSKLDFMGKVYAIEPRVDPATGTIQVRAVCDNTRGKITPGAFVQIDLRLRTIRDALMVPTQSIIPVLKGQTVMIRRNGIVAVVPVVTGTRTSSMVQIVSGLSPGDTVITTGLMQLREGVPVTVNVE